MKLFLLCLLPIVAGSNFESSDESDEIEEQWSAWPSAWSPGLKPASPSAKLHGPKDTNFGCRLSDEIPDRSSGCCGVDGYIADSIVGGETTGLHQHPWMASLEYYNKTNNSYKRLCGGFLISGRHVVTAAHCLTGPILKDYGLPRHVYLGEYDTSNEGPDCISTFYGQECTDGELKMKIEKHATHPNYFSNRTSNFNDIGIIKLANTAPFTDFIRPICLPTFDVLSTLPYDYKLQVAGWGAVSQFNGKSVYDPIKRHVDVPYKPTEICRETLGKFVNKKNHVCAGSEPGKDSCQGDSGGPLMYEKDGTYEALGIVSTGSARHFCGTENYAGLYTNVITYVPWIRDTIRLLNNHNLNGASYVVNYN